MAQTRGRVKLNEVKFKIKSNITIVRKYYNIKWNPLRVVNGCLACLVTKCPEMFVCNRSRYKNYLPLTARFPFSETSNLLVEGMRRTSNWTEPARNRKVTREDRQRSKIRMGWKTKSSPVHPKICAYTPTTLPSPVFGRMVALWMVTSSKVTGVISMTTPRFLIKVRHASTR